MATSDASIGGVRAAAPWKLPPLREGHPAAPDLVERRQALRDMLRSSVEPGVKRTDADWAGVPSIVYEPGEVVGTILYLHGGGYRVGHPTMWLGFASRLAFATSTRVVAPDYRLAPEHPFPAALHDAAATYDRARAEGLPVVVVGDSAGGGLAAALTVACLQSSIPAPAALALISPWVDLTATAPTFESRGETDQLFSLDAAKTAASLYLQGVPADQPLASPLFAEVAGFPPSIVFGGGYEVLLADAVSFASRLAFAGVSVESHVVAAMQHVWVTAESGPPETARSFGDLVRFTRTALAAPSADGGHGR